MMFSLFMPEFINSETELPVDNSFEIIADTNDFVLVNKSGNIPVHQGGRYQEGCLTKLLEINFGKVFPVYRLDRETSGLVLFAKKTSLVHSLSKRLSGKEYLAIVTGKMEKPKVIDLPLGECAGEQVTWKKCVDIKGKPSITEVYPLDVFQNKTLIRVIPRTGRQHQIRVHLSHIGHPIIHDKIYGGDEKKFIRYLKGETLPRQLLHMHRILIDGKEFKAELPNDFKNELK